LDEGTDASVDLIDGADLLQDGLAGGRGKKKRVNSPLKIIEVKRGLELTPKT